MTTAIAQRLVELVKSADSEFFHLVRDYWRLSSTRRKEEVGYVYTRHHYSAYWNFWLLVIDRTWTVA